MTPEERREFDQLFRAVFGRLINSVLANGRSEVKEQSDQSASERAAEATANLNHASPVIPQELQPGRIFGQRFRIVKLLGRGGTAEVYLADDILLGQAVALKFLSAAPTATTLALNCFRNEVRVARQISHENLCRVYDIGEAEGLTYLSMEYVYGENLASLLRLIGKFPRDKALDIGSQICAGLAAVHEKGMVHRDLKPANIMLDTAGRVRLTDFGLAGVSDHIQDICSGTPGYMSPEQVAAKEVTFRSDLYALGVVLHELLTGRRPPLKRGDVDLEPAVKNVIERCLEPHPQMRPTSALKVAAALSRGDPWFEKTAFRCKLAPTRRTGTLKMQRSCRALSLGC
jgi:serine/threonine-protein kinase